jgi:thymidylate synthase (FAD)
MTDTHTLIGQTFTLPNKNAVTLIDTMPALGFYRYHPVFDNGQISYADAAILHAARQSTRATADVQAALTTYERDKKLFTRLWKDNHSTPFEFAQVTLHVVCSLTTRSQWHRHRAASYNEYSRRYSEEWTEFQTPDWRAQSSSNKQASDGRLPEPLQAKWDTKFAQLETLSKSLYEEALEDGMAREVARDLLLTCTLTRFTVSVNLRNLIGFLALRCAPDAQKEIRDLALIIRDQILPTISPLAYELMREE